MGWLKKAVKKVKGGVKTVTGGRTKLGKKIFKAVGSVTDELDGTAQKKAKAKAAAEALLLATPDPELEALKAEATRQAEMPSIDSAAVEEARKKAALLAAARGGRESTMFTGKG